MLYDFPDLMTGWNANLAAYRRPRPPSGIASASLYCFNLSTILLKKPVFGIIYPIWSCYMPKSKYFFKKLPQKTSQTSTEKSAKNKRGPSVETLLLSAMTQLSAFLPRRDCVKALKSGSTAVTIRWRDTRAGVHNRTEIDRIRILPAEKNKDPVETL